MKFTKKLTALLLALLMVFSAVTVYASAINTKNLGAPKFNAVLLSQTSSQAVIELSLVSGNFASVEFTFTPQGNFKSISKFAKSQGLLNFMEDNDASSVSYVSTGRLAIVCATPFEGNMTLYKITFDKRTSANVQLSDLAIKITNCDSYVKASDTENVTSKAAVNFSLIKLELDKYNLDMNYKQSQKINVTTSYDKSKLVWTSSNTKVATVDKDGNVTTVGTGDAVIKVATADGLTFAECNVKSSYSAIQWIIVIVFFGWLWY